MKRRSKEEWQSLIAEQETSRESHGKEELYVSLD